MLRFSVSDTDGTKLCSHCWVEKARKNTEYCSDLCEHTDRFIQKAYEIHGNRYDYSETYMVNERTKMKIICRKHGVYEILPRFHFHHNCRKCGYETRPPINRDYQRHGVQRILERANKAHNNRYTYIIHPDALHKDYMTIICPLHGKFRQNIGSHINTKQGCRKCSNIRTGQKLRKTLAQFIQQAKKVHGDRYDYTLTEYSTKKKKVTILCSIHGMFEQMPRTHLNGSGCIKCYSIYSKPAIDWLEYSMIKNSIFIQHACNKGEYIIPKTKIRPDGYHEETNTLFEYYGDYWHGNPKRYKPDFINSRKNMTMEKLYKDTMNREERLLKLGYNLVTIWESDWLNMIKAGKTIQKWWKNLIKNNLDI